MLSKCANPECSEIFRYLHEGKLFYLALAQDVQIATGIQHPMQERFLALRSLHKRNDIDLGRNESAGGTPARGESAGRKVIATRTWRQRATRRAATAGRIRRPRRWMKMDTVIFDSVRRCL